MPNFLIVMLGGAIGAGLRYGVGSVALRHFGPGFPWGTLAVNLSGGLLMGVIAAVLARHGAGGEPVRLFLGVGILGGFTTFSAFSLEAANMLNRGDVAIAALYALASVIGSVLLLFLGLWIGRAAA